MKVNVEQLQTILRVACLTEDRTPDEQRAMLRFALHVDSERASFFGGRTGTPPTMVWEVEQSYAPSEGRKVGLTGDQRRQLERLHAKFERCTRCGVLMGEHPVECLQAALEAFHVEHGPQERRLL